MARVYATGDQYATYTGSPAPAGFDRRAARASELLDAVLRSATYDVDTTTGLPTDTDVADALSRACCAQVAYWLETGDEQASAAAWSSVAIGSVSMSRTGQAAADDRGRLAPHAATILAAAGLTPGTITHL